MTILNRSEWYDVVRDTNWVPKYVTQEELFPDIQDMIFLKLKKHLVI